MQVYDIGILSLKWAEVDIVSMMSFCMIIFNISGLQGLIPMR